MSEPRFGIAREGHVATVTLAGPGGKPVMDAAFFTELRATFTALDADADVRAIVVRGARGSFSFGLDLSEAAGTFGGYYAAGGAAGREQFL